MVRSKRRIDFDSLAASDCYKIASGLIVPRPIGWIGTVDAAGIPNLAPYSFFNLVAADPPTFVIGPGLSSRKDTLANLLQTQEFTVNLVTEEVFEAMNMTADSYPAEENEFDIAGLTAVASDTVAAPCVGEAKASFECRVIHTMPVGRPRGGAQASTMLVVGESLTAHVDNEILEGTRVDQAALKAVGRHAGHWYSFSAEALRSLERP